MDFITASEVAALLEMSSNARLEDAVAGVQSDFMQQCRRTFIREERTVYPVSVGGTAIWLPEAPIIDVLEVRFDRTGSFQSGGVSIANTPADIARNFRWLSTDTNFELHYLQGLFPDGPNTVMVRFIGGYWSFTDSDPQHEAGKPPADLRRKLKKAATIEYRTGLDERFVSMSVPGVESFTRSMDIKDDPLAQAVRAYGRRM